MSNWPLFLWFGFVCNSKPLALWIKSSSLTVKDFILSLCWWFLTFFIVSLGVLFNFNWHGNSKGCPHWAFYISVMYVGGFPFPPLPSVPQNYLSQQWWYMFVVTVVYLSERQFNDVFYYMIFFTQQKLNCHETDVRWAIKNGDTHDQLKIAYHLILDNKRMRMLGKFSIGMWPVSLEEQVYKALG